MFKVNNKDSVSIASTLFAFILHLHLYIHYFLSSHWAVTVGFAKSSVYVCLVTCNEFSFLTAQKGNGIAGIGYFKVKNNATH